MPKLDKLTSVRVNKENFFKFKQQAVSDNYSFKKLVDKALHLYLTDNEFKEMLKSK